MTKYIALALASFVVLAISAPFAGDVLILASLVYGWW